MDYHFDIDVAAVYGVDESIVLYNLEHWIRHNEANRKHFYKGRTWTYNSVEAFSKLFPFWSKGQIRRILNSLEKQNAIMVDNFNENATDRTLWYALSDEYWACRNQQMHLSKSTNGIAETDKSSNDTDIKHTDIKQECANALFSPATIEAITPEGEKERKVAQKERKTAEPLCLFENSRYNDIELFKASFEGPEFADVDLDYYFHSVADWSSSKGAKKRDWIATARNFMRGDMEKGKLHRKPQMGIEGMMDPDEIAYLKMGWDGFGK